MICQPCKTKKHEECRNGTWCDCAHETEGVNWLLVEKPDYVKPPITVMDC